MAVLINYLGKRGAGPVFAYESAKALCANKIEVVAVLSEYIENRAFWEQLPIKVIYVKTFYGIAEFIFKSLHFINVGKQKVKEKIEQLGVHIDTVYCPMDHPWMPIVNSLFPEAKVVFTLHDPEAHSGEANRLYDLLVDRCAGKADELILLSEKFRENCINKYGLDSSKVHVIPHGDFSYYRRIQKNDFKSIYQKKGCNFLFFGRISPYKGLGVLARAFEIVQAELPDAALVIAGSGDFAPFEREFSKLKKVQTLIRWFADEEVGGFFQGDNLVLVLPYLDATQSGVIPIAAEYGIPVVATATGGIVEQVDDGISGLLVRPGDHKQLAEAMLKLASDKELRQRLAANAKRKYELLSWDNIGKQLSKVIQ